MTASLTSAFVDAADSEKDVPAGRRTLDIPSRDPRTIRRPFRSEKCDMLSTGCSGSTHRRQLRSVDLRSIASFSASWLVSFAALFPLFRTVWREVCGKLSNLKRCQHQCSGANQLH